MEVLQGALTHRGMVFMFNPARHGSLDRFADLTRQAGMETLVEYHYDDVVWTRHQQLTEAAGTPAEVRAYTCVTVGRRGGLNVLERRSRGTASGRGLWSKPVGRMNLRHELLEAQDVHLHTTQTEAARSPP